MIFTTWDLKVSASKEWYGGKKRLLGDSVYVHGRVVGYILYSNKRRNRVGRLHNEPCCGVIEQYLISNNEITNRGEWHKCSLSTGCYGDFHKWERGWHCCWTAGAAWLCVPLNNKTTFSLFAAMEDTNVKLTLDLGHKALAQMARMSNHHIALVWDLGPNVTLGLKYLAGSLLIWKSLEVSWRLNATSDEKDARVVRVPRGVQLLDNVFTFITVSDQDHCCMDIQACSPTTTTTSSS